MLLGCLLLIKPSGLKVFAEKSKAGLPSLSALSQIGQSSELAYIKASIYEQ